MTHQYKSVLEACGKIAKSSFVKAVEGTGLSEKSYGIAEAVLVLGYRQSVVAKHALVSRQRVHSICNDVLKMINAKRNEDK
jgi:hypothetical protein